MSDTSSSVVTNYDTGKYMKRSDSVTSWNAKWPKSLFPKGPVDKKHVKKVLKTPDEDPENNEEFDRYLKGVGAGLFAGGKKDRPVSFSNASAFSQKSQSIREKGRPRCMSSKTRVIRHIDVNRRPGIQKKLANRKPLYDPRQGVTRSPDLVHKSGGIKHSQQTAASTGNLIQQEKQAYVKDYRHKLRNVLTEKKIAQNEFYTSCFRRSQLETRLLSDVRPEMIRKQMLQSEEAVKRAKVVIIGAGLAGMTAAVKLIDHGFRNVFILEAGRRMGGRIRTINVCLSSEETEPSSTGGVWLDVGMAGINYSQPDNALYSLALDSDLLTDSRLERETDSRVLSGNRKAMDATFVKIVQPFAEIIENEADLIYRTVFPGSWEREKKLVASLPEVKYDRKSKDLEETPIVTTITEQKPSIRDHKSLETPMLINSNQKPLKSCLKKNPFRRAPRAIRSRSIPIFRSRNSKVFAESETNMNQKRSASNCNSKDFEEKPKSTDSEQKPFTGNRKSKDFPKTPIKSDQKLSANECNQTPILTATDYKRERQRRLNNQIGADLERISKPTDDLVRTSNTLLSQSQLMIENTHDVDNDLAIHLLGKHKDMTGKYGEVIRLKKGMSMIFDECLKKRIDHKMVRYNACVKTINWGDVTVKNLREGHKTKIKLTCQNGREYAADHVIVTIPIGNLKKHAHQMFTPKLPEAKLDAIEKIGWTSVSSTYLVYNEPLKERIDFVCGNSYVGNNMMLNYYSGSFRLKTHPFFENVLEMTSQNVGLEMIPDKILLHEVSRILTANNIPHHQQKVSIYRSSWSKDGLFLGTHPYLTTRCDGSEITTLAQPIKCGSRPVVQFAGDGTFENYRCLAHAAVASGEREAERLVRYYDNSFVLDNKNTNQ